jgi:hypothetical protein
VLIASQPIKFKATLNQPQGIILCYLRENKTKWQQLPADNLALYKVTNPISTISQSEVTLHSK